MLVLKEAACGLLPLVGNVKSYWWSLLSLANLANSRSVQNGKTQLMYNIIEFHVEE